MKNLIARLFHSERDNSKETPSANPKNRMDIGYILNDIIAKKRKELGYRVEALSEDCGLAFVINCNDSLRKLYYSPFTRSKAYAEVIKRIGEDVKQHPEKAKGWIEFLEGEIGTQIPCGIMSVVSASNRLMRLWNECRECSYAAAIEEVARQVEEDPYKAAEFVKRFGWGRSPKTSKAEKKLIMKVKKDK